jgi:DNA repair photolyase
MRTIERKSLLNKSALGFYCVNHVQGCSHGCLYPCYAFSMARGYGRAKDYRDWCEPALVSNAQAILGRELDRLDKRIASGREERPDFVHFCLTTDPFMYRRPEASASSLRLMEMVNARGIGASILTKGILPVELSDRSRFPSENTYGISLVSLSEAFREKWEPGAAPYADRIAALKALHGAGLRTLVHMEPYPTPNIFEQELDAVLEAVSFVDELYFGGWNYSSKASAFEDREGFYEACRQKVRRFCLRHRIECGCGP